MEYRNIKPGDVLCLTDEQTIKDLMEDKNPNAMDGLKCPVKTVLKIKEANGLAEWILCHLDHEESLYFLVKIVDDEHDLRVYYIPDDIQPMTKGDLINNESFWMFQEPEDPDDFIPADLEYTVEIEQDGAIYSVKGGELHGECREYPKPAGLRQPLMCSIVEYNTDKDVESKEILILEIGGLDDEGDRIEEGGVVTFYLGGNINSSDVELFAN